MIQVFYSVMVPVLIVLALGYIAGRFFKFEVKTLSTLSLYLLTPALIFQSIYKYKNLFEITTLKMLIAITVISVLIIVLVELAGRIFKLDKSTRVVLILTLMLSNSGNFGLPINQYAFGDQALLVASVLLVIYSFYTNTVGVIVAAADKSDLRQALLGSLKMPFFYVLVAGLAVNYFQIQLPDPVFKPIEMIGLSAIPLNLLQLGFNLSRIRKVERLPLVLTASAIKLLVIPAAAYFPLVLMGLQGLDLKSTMLQIAMPPAVYCSILASHYDSDTELASSIVFVSTILSFISLSVLIYLLL
ncbi:MAG: AEC family transporter [Brevinematales bacterium]|nr:AEC family transporter [Brevinematales bacterium]